MKLSDKRYIKSALKDIYAAPEPVGKNTFLNGIRPAGMSNKQFVLSQILYIRKSVWVLSLVVTGLLVWMTGYINEELMWVITACMPFIAMIAVTENVRSSTYRMAELEMAARFSLKSVVFARMTIVGIFHMLLLGVLVLFTGANAGVSYLMTGVYLLVPYLMTAVISMHVARRIRSNEINYVCMGVAVIVAAIDGVAQSMVKLVTGNWYFGCCVALLAVLIICGLVECRRNIFRTEEALWSL